MRPHSSPSIQALYRVFVLPALQAPTRPLVARHVSRPVRPCTLTVRPRLLTARPFSSTPPQLAARGPPARRKQMWDEEITARRVQLVDPDTERLQEPVRLRDLLNSIDRKTHRIVCVTAPPAGDWQEEWIPTCKIQDKKLAYEAEKQKKKQAQVKAAAEGTKTLELGWTIDTNDLGHRMKRMQEFLAQGKKVEVILARKKGGRKVSPEECEELLAKISNAAQEVKGTKEVKSFEGRLAAKGELMFEGPKP